MCDVKSNQNKHIEGLRDNGVRSYFLQDPGPPPQAVHDAAVNP